MPLTRSLSHRARTGLAAAVAVSVIGAVPVLAGPASAGSSAPTRAAVTAECGGAQAALAQARRQQGVARANLAKARKVLRKAKAAHKPAQVRKARKAVDRIAKRHRTLTRTVSYRQKRLNYACAAPNSAARANAAGSALGLLAIANGLDLETIDLNQLTALLDQLLPGVADQLSDGQLTALLAGFNALGGDVDPTALLAQLAGGLGAGDITALLAGIADPAVLQALAGHLLGELSLMGGGFALPESFDPTGLLATFAGIFGQLDPSQLGQLLSLVTAATGGDASALDLSQVTSLLDSLVPGISEVLDPAQLTALFISFTGSELSPDVLATFLGGQFSPEVLAGVLAGTAPDEVVGAVIAQVMAQLATAGGGSLLLPSDLGLEALTGLVDTVVDLLDALTGGGVLPVICGILPLPGLCD